MSHDLLAGIDLGGTKILTSVADRQGNILAEVYLPTEAEKGTTVILSNIYKSVTQAMSEAGFSGEPAALGLGVPGAVAAGLVHLAPNLGWQDFDLGSELSRVFSCPVGIANDANLAALGEYTFGAGRGSNSMLYVTVSTGIGAGIIYRGEILEGESGTAGELGHISIDPNGPLCTCGNHGCLEALASGTAIARRASEFVANGQSISAKELAQAAQQGDKGALKIFEEAAIYLGMGLANAANLLNPQLIILGGGVMEMRQLLWQPMVEEFNARVHRGARKAVSLVPAGLGVKAGVMGALSLAQRIVAK